MPFDGARLPDCTCQFNGSGQPMSGQCMLHQNPPYRCDCCHCDDYRPVRDPGVRSSETMSKFNPWPRCACGHCAQDHN